MSANVSVADERARSGKVAWLKSRIAEGRTPEFRALEGVALLHQIARDLYAIAQHAFWEAGMRQGDVIRLRRLGSKVIQPLPQPVDTELTTAERTVRNVARLLKAQRRSIEGRPVDVAAVRCEAALNEVGRSPVEVAFLYGFSSDRDVRELRRRHGRCPETGQIEHEEPLGWEQTLDAEDYQGSENLGAVSIGSGISTTIDERYQRGTSIGNFDERTSEMRPMTHKERTAGERWLAKNDPRHEPPALDVELRQVLEAAGITLENVREEAFRGGKPTAARRALRRRMREALKPIYGYAHAPRRDLMAEALGTTRQALGRLMRD